MATTIEELEKRREAARLGGGEKRIAQAVRDTEKTGERVVAEALIIAIVILRAA